MVAIAYHQFKAVDLTNARTCAIYDQLIEMYSAEAERLSSEIEEIETYEYVDRPRSELLLLCNRRWLTLASGAPITKHTNTEDMVAALEVADDIAIEKLSLKLARLVDLIALCENDQRLIGEAR